MKTRKTGQYRWNIVLIVVIFVAIVLGIVVVMNIKSTNDQNAILVESIKAQLISTSVAANELIDVDAFIGYNSTQNTWNEKYTATLRQLRLLANNVGAKYIYALKEIDGQYYFVFDTDIETDTRFTAYPLSQVHRDAFAGMESADVMNVEDAFGTFNTGAVPIWKDGHVVGIICTDLEDTYINASQAASRRNAIILLSTLAVTLILMVAIVIILMRRVRQMQHKLEVMAHYDTITGLPNRQYLLDYLETMTRKPDKAPFALFFIDLDNFKSVNDNAGHEAGDELLRHIAKYLDSSLENAKSFRPTAGRLNIAARIGGDEFVQVIMGISTEEEAAATAQKLLNGFTSQHLDRYVEKYGVGLSIGIALFPYHTDSFHVLIKYADTAMYYAKRAGKNQYAVYQDEMSGQKDQ